MLGSLTSRSFSRSAPSTALPHLPSQEQLQSNKQCVAWGLLHTHLCGFFLSIHSDQAKDTAVWGKVFLEYFGQRKQTCPIHQGAKNIVQSSALFFAMRNKTHACRAFCMCANRSSDYLIIIITRGHLMNLLCSSFCHIFYIRSVHRLNHICCSNCPKVRLHYFGVVIRISISQSDCR